LKLNFDTLRTHLDGEPARAYLVSGDEGLLVGEAADAIRARVKRAGFDEREVHFIERVADWETVRASSNNLSLFGSRKLIELRLPSGKPGVGGSNAIVELLEDVSPDNVYLMITGKLERESQGAAWVKAFESAGAWLPIWPIEVARLPQWLRARAVVLDLELDDDAVRFIVERTEGNLLAAQQELEKLRLLAPARFEGKFRIDLATAQAGIGDSARFDVFQPRSRATCPAACASWPACAARASNPRSRSGRCRARFTTSGARRRTTASTRAAGSGRPPRSRTRSAALRDCRTRGSRCASRAPIA
jgi:DNA polymerase-3 subunit delta